MRKGFFARVMSIIDRADLLLEVLDARFPEQTRNARLEQAIEAKGKKLVLVLNKSDLISKKKAKERKKSLEKEARIVFVSSRKKTGLNLLRKEIALVLKPLKKKALVGVIGYPNTGKSSLINALAGRKAVRASIKAGLTRGEQFIRLKENLLLIDSPGIIPLAESDEFRLILTLSKNPEQISDPEDAALKLLDLLLKEKPEELEKKYSLKVKGLTAEKILEEIAFQKKRLLKGGLPDTKTIARQILMDYQKGKLKIE